MESSVRGGGVGRTLSVLRAKIELRVSVTAVLGGVGTTQLSTLIVAFWMYFWVLARMSLSLSRFPKNIWNAHVHLYSCTFKL